MTKITTGQAYQIVQIFSELAKEKIDGLSCYRIAYIMRKKLAPICDSFEEARKKLFETYGVKDDNGNMSIHPEKIKEFQDEINKIASQENDISIELPENKIIIDTKKSANANFAFSADKMIALIDFVEVV